MSHFAKELKRLRNEHNYAMQTLADRANVSKSMISKIERAEVQPTIDVATRLANALDKNLSEMLTSAQPAKIIKIPKNEQEIWEDPQVHFQRHILSPSFPGGKIEWLHVTFPAKKIQIHLPPLPNGGGKYVYLIRGKLELTLGDKEVKLAAGDALYFEADIPHSFANASNKTAEYYIILKHN